MSQQISHDEKTTMGNDSSSILAEPPKTLTEKMRRATKDKHDQSDRLVTIKLGLILTSKPLYAEAISLFWPIYMELESALELHRDHPQLGCLNELLPVLRRGRLFEKDINYWMGDAMSAADLMARRRRTQVEGGGTGIAQYSPPELQAYIDHLRTLSKEDPLLLVPYIYSMYSAILAGGAIIKRTVKTAFALKTEAGVEMFHMSLVGSSFSNIAEFRAAFKQKLNVEMTISEIDQDRLVQEAPQVFARNNALVATAQDTEAFRSVWATCQRYLLIFLSFGVLLLAIWLTLPTVAT